MDRKYYLDLAASGLRMPIGTDLVLREKPDHEAIQHDGTRLGEVIIEAARRYRTPLAIGLMDLMLEKAAMLEAIGIAPDVIPSYHFDAWPGDEILEIATGCAGSPLLPALQAHVDAVAHVARVAKDLVPVGMTIGPFSLMTKLLADPILPVGMAGAGATAEDDPDVALVEKLLDLSLRTILRSVEAQIAAGAKVIVVAEPAANKVFISPNQLADGSDVFERYVMVPNRRIRALLREHGVDLFFHCCGELVECMVRDFASLDPAVMSLGCSRNLWEDAALVPKTTVLFGNLPTKNFYSDDVVPVSKVVELSRCITGRMREAGHPFILGSECDVLSVPGREQTIRDKVHAFMTCEV